jgi:hypothetical protein
MQRSTRKDEKPAAKHTAISEHIEALECVRSLRIRAGVNIIAGPAWDERHFTAVREWALSVHKIAHLRVNTLWERKLTGQGAEPLPGI